MNSKEPIAVTCAGGKPNLPGAEVPETATVAIEYPENYLATFTIGYKAMRYNQFNDQLKQFHGNKARFDVGREWYSLYPEQPTALEMKASAGKEKAGKLQFSGAEPYPQFPGMHSQPQGAECAGGSGAGDKHRALHDYGFASPGTAIALELAGATGRRLMEILLDASSVGMNRFMSKCRFPTSHGSGHQRIESLVLFSRFSGHRRHDILALKKCEASPAGNSWPQL